MKYSDIPLPKTWPRQVKSIILHVISLAQQNAALVRKAAAGLSRHSSWATADLSRHSPPWRDDGGYNELRPHQSLNGKTHQEIYNGLPVLQTQYETRGKNGVKLKLSVSYFKGRKHLPIVSLQRAA